MNTVRVLPYNLLAGMGDYRTIRDDDYFYFVKYNGILLRWIEITYSIMPMSSRYNQGNMVCCWNSGTYGIL